MKQGRLKKELGTDVVIIGGGITGIISAYLLAKAGKKVILLEKGKLGEGVTSKTTAFITELIDTGIYELTSIYGAKVARQITNSHKQAIKLIGKIVKEEKIECDFMKCSIFMYANDEDETESLVDEYEAAKKLGVPVKLFRTNNLGFRNAGYIEMKNQAKFSAGMFLQALAKRAKKNGVKIFENTQALSFSSDDTISIVKTSGAIIKSKWVVVATYEPFNKPLKLYFKKAFYSSYVLTAEIPKGAIKENLYVDILNPYHYFRIDGDGKKDVITIGGEDHRSSIPVKREKNFHSLWRYLEKLLRGIPHKKTSYWRGPILESVDGLAYIGPLDKQNVLYAMAFSGNGMTYAAIAGEIFRDIVTGKKNKWQNVYRADRIPTLKSLMAKGKDYTEEFVHGALKNTLDS